MDLLKKLTELIEDGSIPPPTNTIKKPSSANFILAAYDDGQPGERSAHPAINPAGNDPEGKL